MTAPVATVCEHVHYMGIKVGSHYLGEGVALLTRLLMDLETGEQTGAVRYERLQRPRTHRNGHRGRVWETRVGEMREPPSDNTLAPDLRSLRGRRVTVGCKSPSRGAYSTRLW